MSSRGNKAAWRRMASRQNADQRDRRDAHRDDCGLEPLLTLRAAFILLTATVASGAAGILTYLASASLPAAFLAGGSACATAITVLNAIID
jgi:hypothetical protein